MLGSERLAFETPNVIDPGDLPPSAPRKSNGSKSNGSKSNGSETQHSSSNNNTAADFRQARMLHDIRDLELQPPTNQAYDPYDDDDEEEEVEDENDPRRYAAALLTSSNKASPATKAALGPTVRLDAPRSHHLVRNMVVRVGCRVWWLAVGLTLLMLIVVLAMKRQEAANNATYSAPNNNGSGPQQPPQPHQVDLTPYLQDYVSSNGLSAKNDVMNPESPQAQAIAWMAQSDQALPAFDGTVETDYRFVQRYALTVLFFSTGGLAWEEQHNFLSQHECAWFSQHANDLLTRKTVAIGVSCTADGEMRVRDLYLPSVGLKGTLPTELQHLTSLRLLSFSDNFLTGKIPSGYAALTDLEFVDFKYNSLTGSIPAFVPTAWAGLEVLGLSNNFLTGSIPSSYEQLTLLHTLALDDNMFTGSLNFVNSLTRLNFFYADRNRFSSNIDGTFMDQLDVIHTVDVSGNSLTATEFPWHFMHHSTLHVLDMANNDLSAALPELTKDNLALDYLSLRGNRLTGPVPASWRRFKSLVHLDIYNNTLTGALPAELKELTKLSYLSAGRNSFTPAFPAFLDDMEVLRELNLEGLQIQGTIPSWFSSYTPMLKLLDLSDNLLTGSIPQEVMDLPDLEFLLLHKNNLGGALPSDGGDQLRVFTAFANPLLKPESLIKVCHNMGASAGSSVSLLALDCAAIADATCPPGCCDVCCENSDTCFSQGLEDMLHESEGLWEFGYERQPFSFDPNILDSVKLFQVLDPQN